MQNTQKKLNAADSHPYYVSELKHEIEQAYYRHHEALFQGEAQNLALEIYLLSYRHSEVQAMRGAEGTFVAKTVQFILDDGESKKVVRLDLPSLMPFNNNHEPVVISTTDELGSHYVGLIERMKEVRDSEELFALMSRIDAIAARKGLLRFIFDLKSMGGYVNLGVQRLERRNSIANISLNQNRD